jgi:thiol-disulfide isomerase/thioredoxin
MTMKKILFALVAVILLSGQNGFAEGTNAVVNDLNALVSSVNAKIQQGATQEKDFAGELKAFDVLYAKYKDLKTEDVAQILVMKAKLYLDVIDAPIGDPEKAGDALEQVKRDMPGTPSGQRVDMILQDLKRPIEAERIRNKLVEGTTFPDFNEKDLSGQPLSVVGRKGRVVMVDFWATWCPVCIAELPNVLDVYSKYHDKGFEIIGISLDEDRPTLERFIKENNVSWPQYFDGNKWDNKLAMKYGVNAAPTTYLLDGDGKIIGKNLHGPALEAAVAKALAKN